MQGPRGEAHAVGNDIVTHPWLFTWLPLKAANQPRSAPQLAQVSSDHDNKVGPLALGRTARPNKNQTAAATVDGGAARCSSSNCVKFLHEVSEARASAMLVFSSADSSSEAVEAAVSRCTTRSAMELCSAGNHLDSSSGLQQSSNIFHVFACPSVTDFATQLCFRDLLDRLGLSLSQCTAPSPGICSGTRACDST